MSKIANKIHRKAKEKAKQIHKFANLRNGGKFMLDKIALFLLVVGGVNWGLVGIFQFDLIAWAFGGSASIISRILYIIVALSAIWCISLFFRHNEVVEEM